MFTHCKTAPAVMATQDRSDLRVTNLSASPQSLSFEGGSAGHFAFGVSGYAPSQLPDRLTTITFGPLDPSRRRQDRLDLEPGQSGIIPGRSSYILKIIDSARRDLAALGRQSGDSDVVNYQIGYSYRVATDTGQVIEGKFSQPVSVWLRRAAQN